MPISRKLKSAVRPGEDSGGQPWGFGLLTNLKRTRSECAGYRITVRGMGDEEGYSVTSEVSLEKVSTTPGSQEAIEPVNAPLGVQYARTLDIPHETAVLTPGVWYWLKIQTKRREGVVSVAGKFWIGDASHEPDEWTVGPAYDAFPGAELPEDTTDNFPEDPITGGCCGVWANAAEVSVDDFATESQKGWPLPKKVLFQPVALTVDLEVYDYMDESHLEVLDPYMPGSFPLTYLPDGSAEQNRTVLVRITDTSDARKKRVVPIDNSGRVGEF